MSLSSKEVERLLSKLCVELGFCLPPEEIERLGSTPPQSVNAFVEAVFRAEQLDPAVADTQLVRRVRDRVTQAFNTSTHVRS